MFIIQSCAVQIKRPTIYQHKLYQSLFLWHKQWRHCSNNNSVFIKLLLCKISYANKEFSIRRIVIPPIPVSKLYATYYSHRSGWSCNGRKWMINCPKSLITTDAKPAKLYWLRQRNILSRELLITTKPVQISLCAVR